MSNSVTKIIFPLSGGSHLQSFDYFVEGIISIPYVSVSLNTLHKAVKTLQKQTQKTEVTVTDSIYIYITLSVQYLLIFQWNLETLKTQIYLHQNYTILLLMNGY